MFRGTSPHMQTLSLTMNGMFSSGIWVLACVCKRNSSKIAYCEALPVKPLHASMSANGANVYLAFRHRAFSDITAESFFGSFRAAVRSLTELLFLWLSLSSDWRLLCLRLLRVFPLQKLLLSGNLSRFWKQSSWFWQSELELQVCSVSANWLCGTQWPPPTPSRNVMCNGWTCLQALTFVQICTLHNKSCRLWFIQTRF